MNYRFLASNTSNNIIMLTITLILLCFNSTTVKAKTVENGGGNFQMWTGYIDTCLIVGTDSREINATLFQQQVFCLDLEDPKKTVYVFALGSNNGTKPLDSKYAIGNIWTFHYSNYGYDLAEAKGGSEWRVNHLGSKTYLSTFKAYKAKTGYTETRLATLSYFMASFIGKTEELLEKQNMSPPKEIIALGQGYQLKRWEETWTYGDKNKTKFKCNQELFFNEQGKVVSWYHDCPENFKTGKIIPVDTPFPRPPKLPKEVVKSSRLLYSRYYPNI